MDSQSPTHSPAPAAPATANTSGGPAELLPTLAYRRAWRTFGAHAVPSLGAVAVLSALTWTEQPVPWLAPWLSLAIAILVLPAFYAGGARWMVRTIRGDSPSLGSFFDGFRHWRRTTAAGLVVYLGGMAFMLPAALTVMATAGFAAIVHTEKILSLAPAPLARVIAVGIACLVPATWWTTRLWPVAFVVMEPDGPDAATAVRRSWALTRGSAWRMVGLTALSLAVVLAVFLVFVIASIGVFGLTSTPTGLATMSPASRWAIVAVPVALLCAAFLPVFAVGYFADAHAYEMLRGAEPAGEPAAEAKAEASGLATGPAL